LTEQAPGKRVGALRDISIGKGLLARNNRGRARGFRRLTREEKRDYESRLREMRIFEGVTCSLELAFDYNSRLYVYEVQPDWYDDFLSVEDEIVSRMSDDDMDEGDSLPGYFSKN